MVMMIQEIGSGGPSTFTDMFLFEVICSSFDLKLPSDGLAAVKGLAFGFCHVRALGGCGCWTPQDGHRAMAPLLLCLPEESSSVFHWEARFSQNEFILAVSREDGSISVSMRHRQQGARRLPGGSEFPGGKEAAST